MNAELLEEINELIDNGAGMIEVFEYIQDNTDEDATKYIKYIKALIYYNNWGDKTWLKR